MDMTKKLFLCMQSVSITLLLTELKKQKGYTVWRNYYDHFFLVNKKDNSK